MAPFLYFSSCLTKKEHDPKSSRRLFESSEDDQDETDDERFKIKPQFEGKAGEKVSEAVNDFLINHHNATSEVCNM